MKGISLHRQTCAESQQPYHSWNLETPLLLRNYQSREMKTLAAVARSVVRLDERLLRPAMVPVATSNRRGIHKLNSLDPR